MENPKNCEGCLSRRKFLELSSQSIANQPNGVYTLNFSDYSQLKNPGGSLHAHIHATSGIKDVFVTRVDATTAITVSTICTHAGCLLDALDSNRQYVCNCHNSVFNVDGSVVQGPANQPLPTYASTVTTNAVQINVS